MKKFFKAGLSVICAMSLFAVPAAAANKTAYPSMTKLLVDGKTVEVGAYNINGYNYYKLRDAAMILKDTEKSFSVGYDKESKKILINTNENYTPAGEEFQALTSSDGVTAIESKALVSCDYQDVSGLSVYNIGGYNYFKLRDVAKMVNVGIGYDEDTKIIMISPSSGYVSIQDTKFPLYDVGCFHMADSYCGIYFAANDETRSTIKDVEVIGVTISENNSKMEAFAYRPVSIEDIAKVAENLQVDAVSGIYVDYPFKLGSYMEIRVYAKLTDNAGNAENHCYILTGNVDNYWDMYPNN